jgi:hypothetical protein
MARSLVQMPHQDFYSVLHSNIRWSSNIKLIEHGFSYACAKALYRNSHCVVDDIWDMEHIQISLWQEVQVKFGVLDMEVGDWDLRRDNHARMTQYT